MFKKIMIGLGFVVVLVAALPMLITWNQYKSLIQSEFQKATGRQLEIQGDVRFGILPSPYARVTDAVITNPNGTTSKYFATLKALDVGVAFFPLLKKEIQVTHVALSEPAITLETMANGQNNWQFVTAKKEDTTPETTGDDESSQKISIDNLTIEKGFVRIVNVPEKSQQVIGPIEGTFKIEDLKGPISGRGTITVLEKLPVRFETTIESIPSADNGLIPFRASLALLGNAASVDFKGSLQKGDTSVARVETAASIPHLDKILAAMSKDNKAPELPAFLKDKISMTGLLEVSGKKAGIDNLQFKSGGMEVSGGLSIDTTDGTDIAIDLGRIVMPPEGSGSGSASAGSSESLAKTLENGFNTAAGLLDTALPQSKLGFVLTASQLPIPGKPTMRDVRIAATTGPKGVTLQTIEAKLPGNTMIAMSGSLPARADGKIDAATLNAQVTSQNVSAALGNDGEPMAVNVKTTAHLTRDQLTLKPLELLQNDQTISGDVTYDPKASEALQVAIKGAALNLDSLIGSDKKDAAKKTDGTAQPTTDPLAKLQGLKAKIDVALGRVTFQKKTANNVSVDALLGSDGLQLRTAKIGDLGGMVVQATGNVAQFSPLKGVKINATAQTPNLSETLKSLGNAEASNLGASHFNASLSGSADKLDVDLDGSIDQGKILLKGTAGNINTAPSFNGKIDITHPETATIVRNFGGLKPVTNFGPFALKADVAYGTDTLKANDLLVQLGSAGTLKGHINVVPEGGVKKIDADLNADKLALAALMGDDTATTGAEAQQKTSTTQTPWSREPINLESLRNLNGKAKVSVGQLLYKEFVINNFQTSLNFANNTLTLDTLKGGLFDAGTFNISGQLAPGKTGEAHRGSLNVAVDNTDAAKLFTALGSKVFAQGTLDLKQKLSFSGASQYDLVRSLNGEGSLNVTKGIVNGIDLDGLAAKLDRPNSLTDFAAIIDQARAGGQTPIGDLNAPIVIRDGLLRLDNIAIKTQKTAMSLGGSANLPEKNVDMTGQISFVEQRNLPPLTLYVRGPFNAPQKNFDTRAFTQFYATKATEKLQKKVEEKVQDKLNKWLGVPEQEKPAAMPPAPAAPVTTTPSQGISEPTLGTEETPATVTAPTAPTPPTAPSANSNTATKKKKKSDSNDALKALGGQLLNNLMNSQQPQQEAPQF